MVIVFKCQLISKWFFGVVDFLQNTNENKSHTSKNEFIRSFFGENRWPPKNLFKINWPLGVIDKWLIKDLYQVYIQDELLSQWIAWSCIAYFELKPYIWKKELHIHISLILVFVCLTNSKRFLYSPRSSRWIFQLVI